MLVRLNGLAGTGWEGHVAELVADAPEQWPGECLDVRIVSTNATETIRADHATPLPARTPPGDVVLEHRCVCERFLRRLLLPLLMHDEIFELILNYLQIKQVEPERVRALGASSSAEHRSCSPQNTLRRDDRSWWISGPSSCPNGIGSEWVLYELCTAEQGRARVSFLQLKIPQLPHGPLSVRRFRLEAADAPDGPFVRASPDLTTFNTDRLQEWALEPPIEARFVRIVCTMNAAGDWSVSNNMVDFIKRFGFAIDLSLADSIGFFRIGFS